jgi:hypothetical protein
VLELPEAATNIAFWDVNLSDKGCCEPATAVSLRQNKPIQGNKSFVLVDL